MQTNDSYTTVPPQQRWKQPAPSTTSADGSPTSSRAQLPSSSAPTPSQPDDPAHGRPTWCNASSRAPPAGDDELLEDYVIDRASGEA